MNEKASEEEALSFTVQKIPPDGENKSVEKDVATDKNTTTAAEAAAVPILTTNKPG